MTPTSSATRRQALQEPHPSTAQTGGSICWFWPPPFLLALPLQHAPAATAAPTRLCIALIKPEWNTKQLGICLMHNPQLARPQTRIQEQNERETKKKKERERGGKLIKLQSSVSDVFNC